MDRTQNVAARPRRQTTQKQKTKPTAKLRTPKPGVSLAHVLRYGPIALIFLLPVFGYVIAANSEAFSLKHIEITGAKRSSTEKIEQSIRKAIGDRLFNADLNAIRKVVEAEQYVRAATVVRVLPDTLRVAVDEREPAVVARLTTGRIAWVDADGQVLDDFRPVDGQIPPPLFGFDNTDASDRVAAENRDRVTRYLEVQEALQQDGLFDQLDEVDIKYLRDVKVQLKDNQIVVRLGDRDYRQRLATALNVVAAARRGDQELLKRYCGAQLIDQMVASADSINGVDTTRSNGISVSFKPGSLKAGGTNNAEK